MIALQQCEAGVLLPVRAQAGSRRNDVRGEHDGALKVSVTQVAEKGKANQAIAALLAKALNLRKSQLTLVAGTTSPQKQFLVEGIAREELAERLRQFL